MGNWNKELTFEQALRNILPALTKRVEEKVPEEGKFSRYTVYFDVDASYVEECGISFDYDSQELPRGRIVLFVGRFPDGARQMEQRIFYGTKEEIIQYLRAPERIPELLKLVAEIDQKIKKHD